MFNLTSEVDVSVQLLKLLQLLFKVRLVGLNHAEYGVTSEEKDQKSKRESASKIQQHIIQFSVHTHVQCLMS